MAASVAQIGIGPVMGLLLVATTMIGSGVFLLPATLATVGSISALGWLLAAVGAILIGLTLAGLASVAPTGFIDAIGVVLGPFVGQVAALLWVLPFPLVNAAIAIAVGGNVGFLFPGLAVQPAASLVAMGFITLMMLCAHFGARLVAQAGAASLAVGLVPILLVATLGIGYFDVQTFRDGWNVSGGPASSALFQATILCFWAFLGLEAASLVSRHMRAPEINVPIATVGGVLLATLIYVVATTVIAGMIPAERLARSTAPFADATALIIGSVAAVLVAVAAAVKASGTLGASQLNGAECWLAAQRQLGVHGLSYPAANLAMGLLAMVVVWLTASPTLGAQYGMLIEAVVVLTLLIYGLAGIALARARGGLRRWVALGAAAFSWGLVMVQSAAMLAMAAAIIAVMVALVMIRMRMRMRRLRLGAGLE